MVLAHCPFADRAAVGNEHCPSCLFCHAMHRVLTCNCIGLVGMQVYICIYMSSNHGINDVVQVLQMYKIASASATAVPASVAERQIDICLAGSAS